MKNILLSALALTFALTSCNEWLDVMPDNRAEVDTAEKVEKLLVSAYPENAYIMMAEVSSDNVDDFGEDSPYVNRLYTQIYQWDEVTETDNEDPKQVWSALYGAITNANQALAAIEEMGADTPELKASKGEALLCRAYHHFMLASIFCKAYNPATAATDLGIPYMDAPETELNPKYERGTVAEVFEKIEKDLKEGLPLVNDAGYSVPKYHFNQKAAYTFASRFYLNYGKWDECIEWASKALGTAPKEVLRDYETLKSLPKDLAVVGPQYNSTNAKNNFLIQTAYSALGLLFGPYYYESRITGGNMLMQTELLNLAPWGGFAPATGSYTYGNMYKLTPYVYVATGFDKTIWPRLNYLFEYTDPVAGIGYYRTIYAAFTGEEALLNRAEAYIMKEMYEEALADMNLWTNNTLNAARCERTTLTDESIKEWVNGMEYYTDDAPTPKKALNPILTSFEQGSDMEAYVHAILYIRRVEFYMMGMRWFDVKRYGIEITRRKLGTTLEVLETYDRLTKDDERRAIQLPKDVITAGLTPNPR